MAVTAEKIRLLDVKLETGAGSLARVLGALRETKVNLEGVWGYEMGGKEAHCHLYTEDYDKAKTTLTQAGLKPTESWACRVEGDNKIGVWQETIKKVADAKLNIEATDAVAVGNKFASIIWVDQKDVTKLCKALGC